MGNSQLTCISHTITERGAKHGCFPVQPLCNSYLGEVAHKMTALLVVPGQYVEEEWLHIVIQGLVIQEEFGQQAEVLAEEFADISIDLNRE